MKVVIILLSLMQLRAHEVNHSEKKNRFETSLEE
jgi:hypothetical protein